MRWSKHRFDMVVVFGLGIVILNHKTNGSSCGFSFKNSTEESHLISFFSLCDNGRLPGFSAVHFVLNSIEVNSQACRATVNYTANSLAVRLSKSCELKKCSK